PAQEVRDGLGPLALLQPHAAQLPANPAVQGRQVTLTGRIAEVGHPAGQERVEFTDHPVEADPSAPPSDLPDARLGALQTLRGDAQRAAPEEAMAEELALLDVGHRAFLPVDAQA